ncbi:F-box and leucine-rich repeat protein 13-like [Anabrus simplex]|uniref:F-box and leucine-rich repeat protein 13-like n=1 Tax=Anabrus simplex TaxID=316456 RepID=UPI0035A2CCE9
MEEFPDEVLEKIFSWCTFQDLVWNIPDVNIRWRMVSTRPKIWENRTFRPRKEDDDEKIISVLKRCPRLQAVNFGERVVAEKVLIALASTCADLVKLRLHSSQSISCEILNELQNKCPKIEYFNISRETLTSAEKMEIIGKFMNLKSIHSEWSDCSVNLKPIADGCPRLQCLEAGYIRVELDDLKYFLSKKKDTLRTLVLPCSISGEFNKCTIPCLSVCTALESLGIHWNCENEPKLLARTLGSLKTLKSLTWQDFDVHSIDDMSHLFGNKNLAHLVRLEFCSFFLYNDAVTKIIVENCPNLQGLHLGVCEEFTDKTMEMLIDLQYLKEIGIYGNDNLTDEGMKCLLRIKQLEYLLLGGCNGLTVLTFCVLTSYTHLKVLKFQCQSLKNLPWHTFSDQLKDLRHIDIYRCKDLNVLALKALKEKMPLVTFSVDETSQLWAGYETNQFE